MFPEVTVLIAAYNAERWISECVKSVLTQTFENFEVVIINDGSTDGTLAEIKSVAETDKRIRFYSKPNTGLTDSLNYGLKVSKGRWVARLDADDLCAKDRLSKQLEAANENCALVLVGSGLTFIDSCGLPLGTFTYPTNDAKLRQNLSRGYAFFPHSSALIRMDALKAVNGYRCHFLMSQDLDLWLRLSEIGEIHSLTEPLVYIRKHADQLSKEKGADTQVVYSHMAVVSHELRRTGAVDPLDCKHNECSAEFLSFISRSIDNLNIKKVSQNLRCFKSILAQDNSYISKTTSALMFVVARPFFLINIFLYRLLRKYIPFFFAKLWLMSQKAK